MRKLAIFLVAISTILMAVPALASEGPVTREYGDYAANGAYWLDGSGAAWDLTECDLTITYTLDMSGYTPPMWGTAWSSVGVSGGAWGWMSSGAPAAADTNPNSQDIDDKLNLGAPDRYDETTYDATGPETLVTPPIGNPYLSYGIWFDRDGVDPWQANNWGMTDGVTYNTGGVYEVEVTYHAIDGNVGTMFATVNGEPTGFYDSWRNGPPHHPLAGKSIQGDLTQLQVFASLWGAGVKVYDLTASGCLYEYEVDIDIKPGSCPNSISLRSRGRIAVAILTTADYDATAVDPASVVFAGAAPIRWAQEDVDDDGDVDLVFHFKTQELALDEDSTEATLTGTSLSGNPIWGSDTVRIVPPNH